LPEYSVIDLDLRAFEQELGDEKLQYLANSMAVSASHEARKLLRLQRQGIEAIFVFRLPVMLDWSVFPKSLMALKTALRQEAQKFESNAQLLIWTSNFEQQYEFLNKPGTFLDTFDLDDLRQSEFLSLARTGDVLFEHAGAAQFFFTVKPILRLFFAGGQPSDSKTILYGDVFLDTAAVEGCCSYILRYMEHIDYSGGFGRLFVTISS